MPTSYCHLATHIIFSTKDRYKFLMDSKHLKMNQYIAGIIKNVKGTSIIVNGGQDHVHILCLLPKEMHIAEFVRTIKSNSSKWFSDKHHPKFSWQSGYAAFSVSKSNLSAVETYIKNQEEHNKQVSFGEEFKHYLEKHGFVYSEE